MTTTALVPYGMYDSQVLDVIRRINAPKKPDLATAVKAIRATVSGICMEGAISILTAFGYPHTEFHYRQNKWTTDDLCNEEYFPELQGRRADETMVFWFWGGPPNKLKWYQGTLQTLLEDRILCEIEERGVEEVAKWVGTDLEALA